MSRRYFSINRKGEKEAAACVSTRGNVRNVRETKDIVPLSIASVSATDLFPLHQFDIFFPSKLQVLLVQLPERGRESGESKLGSLPFLVNYIFPFISAPLCTFYFHQRRYMFS